MKRGISHETSTCTRTALSYGRSSAFRLQPDLNPAHYSIDEASRALVEKLEHYAASLVYGDETTTDISLNGHTLSDSGNEDSNCKN